jgi:hypothetical protein
MRSQRASYNVWIFRKIIQLVTNIEVAGELARNHPTNDEPAKAAFNFLQNPSSVR